MTVPVDRTRRRVQSEYLDHAGITAKDQVTIPRHLRLKLGLLPHTDVTVEETDDGVVIRPVRGRPALVEKALREARGVVRAAPPPTTWRDE